MIQQLIFIQAIIDMWIGAHMSSNSASQTIPEAIIVVKTLSNSSTAGKQIFTFGQSSGSHQFPAIFAIPVSQSSKQSPSMTRQSTGQLQAVIFCLSFSSMMYAILSAEQIGSFASVSTCIFYIKYTLFFSFLSSIFYESNLNDVVTLVYYFLVIFLKSLL